MKPALYISLALAVGGAAATWGDTLTAPPSREVPDCCVAPSPAAALAAAVAATPLPARSIYQLESTWIDDAGGARRLVSLRGGPVVMAMIFTQCQYACPMLAADLQDIRAALPEAARDRARFLLVSFDEIRDTPEALRAYRRKMGLEDSAWTLLRGEAGDVRELAMLLGVKYRREPGGGFSHSNLITVLNTEGEIVLQREGLRAGPGSVARAVEALP